MKESAKLGLAPPPASFLRRIIQGWKLSCSLGRQTVDSARQEEGKTKEGQLSFTWSRHPPHALIHALPNRWTIAGDENG